MTLEPTNNLAIFISYQPMLGGYELLLGNKSGDVPKVYEVALTERDHTPSMPVRPTAILSQSQVQQLMDELWRAGVRPNNGQGGVAQVEALQNHLADMQKISFSLLDKATSQPYVINEMS